METRLGDAPLNDPDEPLNDLWDGPLPSFFCELYAPDSMTPLVALQPTDKLGLSVWVSGFNGKTILRCAHPRIEWAMDSSQTDYFVAQGYLAMSWEAALAWLEAFQLLLLQSDLAHRLIAEDAAESDQRQWALRPEEVATARQRDLEYLRAFDT